MCVIIQLSNVHYIVCTSLNINCDELRPSCFVGIEIVRKALRIPCHTIAANAGVDAQEVVTRVMQDQPDFGYDALHDTYVDMMKAGIIDPTKVSFHRLLTRLLVIMLLLPVLMFSWTLFMNYARYGQCFQNV